MKAKLDAGAVVTTIDRLNERIEARFPDSGLKGVCAELAVYGRTVSLRARQAGARYLFLRVLIIVLILGAGGGAAWALAAFPKQRLAIGADLAGLTQGLDAAVHLLLVTGAGVWGLLKIEERLKRARAIGDLYRLRSFAHVVDMHQLTKDPTVILARGQTTAVSPKREMTQFQLTRYLDYCAELLALIGKLAALYGEFTRDPEVVEAITGVEDLTGNLGRKIWQKITILSALEEAESSANAP
jgi:hypothetical protein